MKHQQASVMLSLLVIMAILGLMLKSLSSDLLHSYQISQHRKYAPQLNAQLLQRLLLPSSGPTTNTITVEHKERHITGTAHYVLPEATSIIFRLDQTFLHSELCNPADMQWLSPPPEALQRSLIAPIAAYTCHPHHLSIQEYARTKYNLETESISQSRGPSTMVVHGYLAVSKSLSIKSDLLIIAGGDIWIDSLEVKGSGHEIAIISLNGGITINQGVEGVEIFTNQYSYLSLPAGISQKQSTPLLEQSQGWLSGLVSD